jgi:hypothetical protein
LKLFGWVNSPEMALTWRSGGRFRANNSRNPAVIVLNIFTLQLLFYGAASAFLIALGATFGSTVDIFHIIDPRRLRFDGSTAGWIDALVTVAGFAAATMAMPYTIVRFKLVPDHAFTLLFFHFCLCCITGVRRISHYPCLLLESTPALLRFDALCLIQTLCLTLAGPSRAMGVVVREWHVLLGIGYRR